MKKHFFLLAFAGAFALQSLAQSDDMYFSPSKSKAKELPQEAPAYYVGSNRNVDEYNRRGHFGSSYQPIGTDSLGNDVFTFQKGTGVYPDSSYVDTVFYNGGNSDWGYDDFPYTRRLSRWYGYYDPWLYSCWGTGMWGFYDPWYDPWFDPWYYGSYVGWYNPWFYGYRGWGWPYYGGWYGWAWNYPYWGGGHIRFDGGNPRGLTGNRTWSYGGSNGAGTMPGRFTRTYGNQGNGGARGSYTPRSNGNRTFGSRINNGTYQNNSQNRTYIPNRPTTNFGNSTRSTSSFGGSMGGGNFGGGHAGGGFGGGHVGGGGGGHFGGGRR